MGTYEKPTTGFDWTTAGEWNAWFAINAVVPCVCAYGGFLNGGHAGFLAALVLVWLVGFWLAGRFDIGRSLVWGAPWLAVTQCVPVLQLAACYAAMLVVSPLRRPWAGEHPIIFLATLLAAQPLLGVATLIGYWWRWVRNDLRSQTEADPDL